MTERELEDFLADVIYDHDNEVVKMVHSFEGKGILTTNRGLVINMRDGSEFQITIVKSK